MSEVNHKEKTKRAAEAERKDAKRIKVECDVSGAAFQKEILDALAETINEYELKSKNVALSTAKSVSDRLQPSESDEGPCRRSRTDRRVYCGKSKFAVPKRVGTLVQLTQSVFIKNPALLMRNVPPTFYVAIEPLVAKMPYEKLRKFGKLNPMLHDKIDPLFFNFIKKEFPYQATLDFGSKSNAQVCHDLYVDRKMVNNSKLNNLRAKFSSKTRCVGRKAITIELPTTSPTAPPTAEAVRESSTSSSASKNAPLLAKTRKRMNYRN